MRTLDRLLLHPAVQRLGGVQALVSSATFIVGLVTDIQPLTALGVVLLVITIALLAWPRFRGERTEKTTVPEPEGTREFARRDDAAEVAQRCHMLAASIERWVESFKRHESATVERMTDEWVELDPSLDRAEARRRAYTRNEKNWETEYVIKYRAEAKALFVKAYELGEIAKEHEDVALKPLASQFDEVPKLFNEIADSIYGVVK